MLSVAAAADGCGDSINIAVLLWLIAIWLCLKVYWLLAAIPILFGGLLMIVLLVQCQYTS